MKINIAQEIKQPGKAGACRLEERLEPQEYLGRRFVFVSPLAVDCEYLYDGEAFCVKGNVSTMLASECARCSKPFPEPFSFEFSERFTKEPDEDGECYTFRGDELDITQMIQDNLFLNIPAYSLCKADCKGLCPVCGCDLNIEQCSCQREEKENPFAALEQLLYHDKEV